MEESYNNFLYDFTARAKLTFWELALEKKEANPNHYSQLYYTLDFLDKESTETNINCFYNNLLEDDSLINLFRFLRCLSEYSIFEVNQIFDFNLTEIIKIFLRKTLFLPDSLYRFFHKIYLKRDEESCLTCGRIAKKRIAKMDQYLFNVLLYNEETFTFAEPDDSDYLSMLNS